jgi:hypothetical protein
MTEVSVSCVLPSVRLAVDEDETSPYMKYSCVFSGALEYSHVSCIECAGMGSVQLLTVSPGLVIGRRISSSL